MSERKTVTVAVNSDESFYDILDCSTPDQVIAIMEEYKKTYSGRDIFFRVEGYGYDGGLTLELHERRPETDREMEQRLRREAKEAASQRLKEKKQEDREFKEYVRLKKKFEKTGVK